MGNGRFPSLANIPDLIMPSTTQMLAAVKEATGSVPVVFVNISDPVGTGFVDSLARPGGNVTGFTNFEYAMGEKWLQTLKDIAPGVTRTAIIANPKLILADEPTGNLHSSQGEEIMKLFQKLNAEGTTIIQVTHSEKNAGYGSRVIQLRDGWVTGDTKR